MARLVHERATVEFPRATPLGAIVILLWSTPINIEIGHVDSAKPLLIDCTLHELERRIPSVLLHHKQADPGAVAGAHKALPIIPASSHRLLCNDMPPSFGDFDTLLGV